MGEKGKGADAREQAGARANWQKRTVRPEWKAEALAFVRAHWTAHDYGPSYEEIRDGCPSMSSTLEVRLALDALWLAGLVNREPGKHRSVRPVPED